MKFPLAIQNLIEHFSHFPSVGPKTAQRYVFYLLKQPTEELQKLAQFIAELKEKTITCSRCLSLAESNPCPICADKKRRQDIICIVASTQDMLTLEATSQYNGLYHILGGLINTIEEIKPEQLNIKQLIEKIEKDGIKEIILALNPTLEGETTVLYLVKLLKPYKIKITRLAKGLPTGADLEYADEITLANALKYRNEL
ncbi:MAG: recombination mediator RecR [Patescibacteria group bacterium]